MKFFLLSIFLLTQIIAGDRQRANLLIETETGHSPQRVYIETERRCLIGERYALGERIGLYAVVDRVHVDHLTGRTLENCYRVIANDQLIHGLAKEQRILQAQIGWKVGRHVVQASRRIEKQLILIVAEDFGREASWNGSSSSCCCCLLFGYFRSDWLNCGSLFKNFTRSY